MKFDPRDQSRSGQTKELWAKRLLLAGLTRVLGKSRLDPLPDPASSPVAIPIGKLALSKRRLILALMIAGVSDVISVFDTFTPFQFGVDFLTAILLFVVLGWRWALLPVLVVEAIPALSAFPTWFLVVLAIVLTDKGKVLTGPKGRAGDQG